MAQLTAGEIIWRINGDSSGFDKKIKASEKGAKGLGKTWKEELAAAQPVLTKMGWKHETTVQIPWARPKILKLVRTNRPAQCI